ncbi:Ubiquinone/menaquinone biosynthesis C-methylase UbiE [Cupriavidus sp. YR651]|uniref:class I SAM-dependent methyltransferase n=1 Tax=Cupriavidus sp. YR651 TaxID=1855315 RepID=UPI00088C2B40|nr:class I SAM-dependent methyltransferase [Cupriavidus sp. YR651]SDC86951.1 Ubiquinone/menaquinone biosynthesis C-methylase UbiE [Cupriavidus sp. YR651]
MNTHGTDNAFAGSIPELYDTSLVPLIFEPYAADLAGRAASLAPKQVLEIAAGTGVVTRMLARALPDGTAIVATDLNPPMLDRAKAVGTSRPVTWQQADAQQLPFGDARFDLVICQFGAMFFPDKPKAFAEARRVLMPGGTLLFNVWDRIEDNAFAHTVTLTLANLFPDNPPAFLSRTPHGYHDRATVESDLRAGGFSSPIACSTVTAESRAASASVVAVAYCQGTPLRAELEALGPDALSRATIACTDALATQFGSGPVSARIQAHVFSIKA